MAADNRPDDVPGRMRLPLVVLLTVLVGVAASVGAWWLQQRSSDKNVEARFAAAVHEAADAIDDRLSNIESASLATRALFESSDEVTAAEFAGFMHSLGAGSSLTDRYPGLVAIAAVDGVSRTVTFVSPAADSLGIVGEKFSQETMLSALDRATDLALPIVAVRPETGGASQLAMATALYSDPRAAQSVATEAVRRRSLDGWVVVLIEGDDLVRSLLPVDVSDSQVILLDADGAMLARSSTAEIGEVERRRDVILNLRGATLTLRLEVGPDFTTGDERRVPLLILLAGLLLTAALAVLVWLMSTQRVRALVMVDEATSALARANEDLADTNERLHEFAGVVAHDLKNPLVTVKGFVGLVARQFKDSDDEDTREFLGRALAGADRMANLIDDLLQYAVADRELADTELVVIDDLIGGVLDSLAGTRLAGDRITVETGATVEGHRPSLRQLFANLLGNSLKFRRDGVPVQIEVTAALSDGRWVCTVTDNGMGIPADQRARVLEAFARTETDRDGTGLGLAICQRIVVAHDGDITVGESPSGGTSITFDLPAAG